MARSFVYTIDQAVKAGKYIDCTETAKYADYHMPVYVTPGIWNRFCCADSAALLDLLFYVRNKLRHMSPSALLQYKGIDIVVVINCTPITGPTDICPFLAIYLPEED